MKNKIDDLRNHLFETIEQLKDENKPMDLARAKAIADVAQTIINSAKVEVDMVNAIGAPSASTFFPAPPAFGALPAPAPGRNGTARN